MLHEVRKSFGRSSPLKIPTAGAAPGSLIFRNRDHLTDQSGRGVHLDEIRHGPLVGFEFRF